MKYAGMPFGMWVLFSGSFQKQLTAVLGYDAATARAITKKAKPQYRQIIAGLPEFEKADRFKMNLVNCAMVGAFILSMPQRPEVDRLTDYYARSMMTKPMQWFCRKSGKSKFTPKDIAAMKATAALLHIPGFYRLVPGVFVKSTRSVFGPAAGFVPKELQTGNGVWRVDMMKCPYHDTCTEYGCPELCRSFCDSDDISYTGLHPKLIWERSMTLGRGNDRCDFCMKVR